MDGQFAYEFIGFGAMEFQFTDEFIGFGAMEVQFAYEFIGFGQMLPWCSSNLRFPGYPGHD